MITIFNTLDVAQANLIQSILQAAGIDVFMPNNHTVGIGYSNPIGGVELQVKETERDKAVELLKQEGFQYEGW